MFDYWNAMTRGWNLVRLIRVFFGITALIYAFQTHDFVLGIAGILLTVMAVANIGCCAGGSCAVSSRRREQNGEEKEHEFEEIT